MMRLLQIIFWQLMEARVTLYNAGNAKLATTSTGVSVTGETNTTTLASGNSTMTGLVQIGNSSGGTLLFKRPSANYIFADQTGRLFSFWYKRSYYKPCKFKLLFRYESNNYFCRTSEF